jgi:phage terminase large subunit GpA-like protein
MNSMITSTAVASLVVRTVALFAPPAEITVSEWADKNRYLTVENSAEPGNWKTRSYQREPMDCCSDPTVRRVVLKAGTQLIKTSTAECAIGRMLDVNPGPVLVLCPRKDDAMYFAEERFDPMVRNTPCLAAKQIRSKKLKKLFRGSTVNILSAGTPANAASRAIMLLICDEIDKFRVTAEGNMIAAARQRLATYKARGKEIDASSPTFEGSEIDKLYEQSDQREFFLTCPFCNFEQSLMRKFWKQVRWDSSLPSREEQAATAAYYCESCDKPWDDDTRWAAVDRGRWIAGRPFNGVAGFWISELYSYSKRLFQIVLDYFEKKESADDYRVWVNTCLAENYAEQGDAPDWAQLVKRCEEYPNDRVPRGALVMTAGADVHPDRIEVEWVGWGRNRESWSLRYEIIEGRTSELVGQPGRPSPWEQLESLMSEVYPHELGGDIHPAMLFIDSGNQSNDVYQWVRTQPQTRVVAIKGVDRGNLPVGQPSAVDVNYRGRVIRQGLRIRTVVGPFFKAELYADLKKPAPTEEEIGQGHKLPSGYCHFPKLKNYTDEHFRQLCAEQLVTIKNKRTGRARQEWQQLRARNEALDCRVYARAAAWDLGVDRFKEHHWKEWEHRLTADLFPERPAPKPTPEPAAEPAAVASAPMPAPRVISAPGQETPRGGWIPKRSWF